MDVTSQFLVTAVVSDYDAFSVTAERIETRLNDSYRDSGYAASVTVVKYDPEDMEERFGINAIKRIRTLLGCSLVEGKMLTDLVKDNQTSLKYKGIEVEFVRSDTSTGTVYRVIDNR